MKNIALILAGGLGSRLGKKSEKIFTKISGKSLINHAIEKVKLLSLSLNIITRPDLKKKFFFTKNVYIQKKPLGTGHAIKVFLKNTNDFNYCLVINCDTPFIHINDLKKIVKIKEKNDLIILGYKNKKNSSNGVIIKNNKNKYLIKEYINLNSEEKKIDLCFSGVLLFNKKITQEFFNIKKDPKKKEFLITDLLKVIYNKNYKVNIVKSRYPELCTGINTKNDILAVKKILKKRA